MILDLVALLPHVPSLAARFSTTPRNGLSELQSGRIALGIAQVPAAMQSRRPVLCCGQVDRLRMQVILPDASLCELDCLLIVRRAGRFNDFLFPMVLRFVSRGRLAVGLP